MVCVCARAHTRTHMHWYYQASFEDVSVFPIPSQMPAPTPLPCWPLTPRPLTKPGTIKFSWVPWRRSDLSSMPGLWTWRASARATFIEMSELQRWNFWDNKSFFYTGNVSGSPKNIVEDTSKLVGETIWFLSNVNHLLSWEIHWFIHWLVL